MNEPLAIEALRTLDLVERARGGDQTAWEILVARYRAPLTRFAQARLARQPRRMTDTDDVVQDVTISVFKRLHQIELRFPGALLAYLRRSVANRVADEHRRVQRHGLVVTLNDEHADARRSPLDETIGRDQVRAYRTALLSLNADDRLAIVMRIEQGAGYEAIALRLAKPTANAARVAVARAMFKLAQRMGPQPAGPTGQSAPPAAAPTAPRTHAAGR